MIRVASKMLRELFRKGSGSDILQKATSKNPKVLDVLLEIIKPVDNQDFIELNGCHVLPLADGSLGTIKLIDDSKSPEYGTYYLADEKEIKLFGFASAILTSLEPGQAFKEVIVESKKFNITRLSLSDIGIILKKKDFHSKTPTSEMDTWLAEFWAYWHWVESPSRTMEKAFMSILDIKDHLIFEATHNGVRTYVRPVMLDTLPSVIQPADEQQQALCNMFPGIHQFNRAFLPGYIQKGELSFNKGPSFGRFVKTLLTLATNKGLDLESFTRDHLGPPHFEVCTNATLNKDRISNRLPY